MKKKFLGVFLGLVSVLIIYYVYREIPSGHFNWEDAMFLGDAAKVWTKGNLRHVFTPWMPNYVRYFRQPLFVIFYRLFGYTATPYLVFVLILRMLNVFLIFLLTKSLTGSLLISFFSSLFYGIYQINFQQMYWISSGTKEEPMVTFFLLSFLVFIKYLEEKKKPFLFLSSVFFFLCFHCEFKAFSAPLVFLVYEGIFSKDFFKKEKLFKFKWLYKYLPFLVLEFYFFRFVYNRSASIFVGFRNRDFLLAFPASLPYYFTTFDVLMRWRVKTQDWGFNPLRNDRAFLIPIGLIILSLYLFFLLFLKLKKKLYRFKVIFFLLLGTFACYLPVMLMVLSGYSIDGVITVHWRYFALPSALACILTASFVFWLIEEILMVVNRWLASNNNKDQELLLLEKYPIAQILICLAIFNYHQLMVKKMINDFLLNSTFAKKFFYTLKREFPEFEKEAVLAIEGVEDESSPMLFSNRYLFENIFAMYAKPNNPDYLKEQQKLEYEPNEGPHRKLYRVLYYTNLKDVLVGEHQFMYREGNVSWAPPNLLFITPTFDREFLGAIYGLYDPEKFVVIKMHNKFVEYGEFTDLTKIRKTQFKKFLTFYCFRNGVKTCKKALPNFVKDKEIREIYNNFSPKGKEVFDYLISLPSGPLPDLYTLKI